MQQSGQVLYAQGKMATCHSLILNKISILKIGIYEFIHATYCNIIHIHIMEQYSTFIIIWMWSYYHTRILSVEVKYVALERIYYHQK